MVSDINSGTGIKGININPYEDIGLATGIIRSGKSYAVKKLTSPFKRVIVWDYNHEHTDKKIIHKLNDLNMYWRGSEFFLGKKKTNRVAFQPIDKTPEAFALFLKWVYRYCRYVLLEIEELGVYTRKNKTPPILNTIIDTGRHQPKIGLWCTSRRVKGLTTELIYNAKHILVFKQYKPDDIDYIQDHIGSNLVETLKDKPDYHFVYFNAKTGDSNIHKPL